MSDQISINVQTRADTSGFTDAERAAQKSAATFAGLSAQEQKAAASALKLSSAAQKLATETARTSTAANQAAVAAQRLSTEEQRTATALAQAAAASTRAETAAFRLAQAQDKAATSAQRSATYAQQMGQAVSSSLLGVVAPAAAAGAALGAITVAAQKAEAAFMFKAEMDATTASINSQLSSVRDMSLVWTEASAVGAKYRITQADTNAILASSVDVLRTSSASVGELEIALLRLGSRDASKPISEAARALRELNSGDVTTIKEVFNVGAADALRMKNEIAGGADAVQVLTQYLDRAGSGMNILEQRTKGATGKLNQLRVEGEKLTLALGEDAAGPGLAILNARLVATQSLTADLQGNWAALADANQAFASTLLQTGDFEAALAERTRVLDAATKQLAVTTPAAATGVGLVASATMTASYAADAGTAALSAYRVALDQLIPPTNQEAAATLLAANAHRQGEYEARAFSVATDAATFASLADAAAKQEQAAQTELASLQATAAADAFMMLHPEITASGFASSATAKQIDPLLAQLVLARLRAAEATQELVRFRALAGMAAMGRPETGGDALTRNLNSAAASQKYLATQAERAAEAQRQQVLATGSTAQKVDILKQNYDAAVRSFGRGSAEAINAQTKLMQAQASAAKGGGGGGGGGGRVSAAEATGSKLADIERSSGGRLAEITESTNARLLAIDEKYAEQRARAAQDLADQIAESNAGERVSQSLNNFEAFQKDMTDQQAAAFAEREAAEIRYNERVTAAQEQARAEAVGGDAALAAEKLKIRTDEAKRQMEIEQKAAQANAATEGKQAEAVAATAAQASAAAKAEADTQIAIAEAKAAERTGAQQAEKDAVIAAAEEQKNKVIEAATEQADRVKGVSDSQKSTVIDNLRAQADAAGDWASAIESASRRAGSAMGSVTGPPAAVGDEGGGAPTSDGSGAPGGQGLRGAQGLGRSASGGGGGSMTDAISTLNDAAEILKILKPFVASNKGAVKLLNEYRLVVTSAVGSLLAIQDLRERLVQPQPVLDPAVVLQLKADVEFVVKTMFDIDASMTSKVRVLTKYLELETAAVDILNKVVELRGALSKPTAPIDLAYVKQLHAEGQAVVKALLGNMMEINQQQMTLLQRYADGQGKSVQILNSVVDLRTRLSEDTGGPFDMGLIRGLAKRAAEIVRIVDMELVPLTEEQAAGFTHYVDAAAAAVQVLTDVADLRSRLSEDTGSAFDMGLIRGLAMRAKEISQIVQAQLVPTTEEAAAGFARYAEMVGASVQTLVDVTDLRTRLSEDTGLAFNMNLIKGLAARANEIARIVQSTLIPTSEDQAEALSRYADSVGSAVGIISDVASLRADVAELSSPIPVAVVQGLAAEAKRIAQIVATQLVPTSEEQAAQLGYYADRVGAVVSVVSDVAGLRKDALDLAPPLSVAQITRLADDAKRITQIVTARLVPSSEEQAEAAKRFADTTGAAVSALSDTLGLSSKLFADYQSPSDAQLDMITADANRIVKRVDAAARIYGTEGLEAAQAFGDATGSVLGAFKDQLLFAQAVGSGDFLVKPANLLAFEQGMAQTLAVAGRLGAQAAMIPTGNIAALQGASAALTAAYESMIRLSAVPAGNIPQMTGGLAGGGGGSVVNIHPGAIVVQGAGQNAGQIADVVFNRLSQRLGGRR